MASESNTNDYHVIIRSLKWIISLLLVQFVLGVLLTTVINFNPHKYTIPQDIILVAHIVVALSLIAGSIAHIFITRKYKLLGIKPILGSLFILGAIVSGSIASSNAANLAVMFMALFFGAAIVTYGLSYLKVTLALNK